MAKMDNTHIGVFAHLRVEEQPDGDDSDACGLREACFLYLSMLELII